MRKINYFNLGALLIAVFLWISAPFVFSNFFSLFSLPKAYDLIFNDYYGSLLSSFEIEDAVHLTAKIAAGGSGIAIIAALITTLHQKSTILTKFHCIMGLLSMMPVVFALLIETEGELFEDFSSFFGYGFLGIFLIFILIPAIKSETFFYSAAGDNKNNNKTPEEIRYELKNELRNELRNELLEEMHDDFRVQSQINSREIEIQFEDENIKKNLQDKMDSISEQKRKESMQSHETDASENKNENDTEAVAAEDNANTGNDTCIFCKHCGEKIAINDPFCGYCGSKK